VKIATDQLSLIVRTLERIDALQRVLAQERQALMAEDETETEDYEAAVAHFLGRIDDLAEQKCRERLEAIAALGTSVGSG
jgi:aminopeptidase N